MLFTALTALSLLAATISAHGNIKSHTIRGPGEAFRELCGENAYKLLTADQTRSHQNLINTAPTDPTFDPSKGCNFYLCKGTTFEDNSEHVYKFRAGQMIDIEYIITVPHDGNANMSVVDTTLDKPIGEPLKIFEKFGARKDNPDELKWSFTMSDVGKSCTESGKCVLQFWWHSESAAQTYSSCIDFTQ